MNFVGERSSTAISFMPGRSAAFASNSQVRNMLSASPTRTPLIAISASVSRPSQRSSTRSHASSASGTSKVRV